MAYTRESIKAVNAIPITRVIPDTVEGRGNRQYCRCPECGSEGKVRGKQRGMQVYCDPVSGKNFAKCYQCGFSLAGALNAYAYYHNKTLSDGKDYIETLRNLASENNIELQEVIEKKSKKSDSSKDESGSFCAMQLFSSGLSFDDVKIPVNIDGGISMVSAFKKGSYDSNTGIINEHDDEMVILYYDLDGNRRTYIPKGARTKALPYVRIRFSNPDARGMKYMTPKGAPMYFYIPQRLRALYQAGEHIETLYIQEGEKKAEKACKHGLPSIGIQGIYNIGRKEDGLPPDLQYIVSRCKVKNVVFMMDADWQDLSSELANDDDVDMRPRMFAGAVIKFRKFVRTLHTMKLDVDIWWGHVNHNEGNDKGVDDLLNHTLRDREEELLEDIETAMMSHDGHGVYVDIHNITSYTDYKIQQFWNLTSNDDFFSLHKERLSKLKTFRFDKTFYVVDKEKDKITRATEYGNGEEFWLKYDDEGESKIKIYVKEMINFLTTNGFRAYRDEEGKRSYVKIDKGVISEIDQAAIVRFVYNYVCKASKDPEIHEYFANCIDSKLSAGKLQLLEPLQTTAGIPEQYRQRFFYKDREVVINSAGISTESLIGPVWEKNLVDRKFKRCEIIRDIRYSPSEGYSIELTEEGKQCEFLTYLYNTSNFDTPKMPQEKADFNRHIINKLTCIGFLLRDYKSYGEGKAVIAMDGRMSEVNASNGRTGKSLIGLALKQVINQAFVAGRKVESSDDFIFNDVRETTKNVFIDDVKLNFNIGDISPSITGDFMVNIKQGARFTIPFERAPKIYITTNHAINSEGDSTDARTMFMVFSPWYNKEHTPTKEFGHNFFSDWDSYQWMLFDNLMMECVRYYMKSLDEDWAGVGCGMIEPPMDQIKLRKDRQLMGEDFFQWADTYFDPSSNHLNNRIVRKEMFEQFHKDTPGQLRFVNAGKFRKKLIAYCEFRGYHLNAHKPHEETGQDFPDWIATHPGETFIGQPEKTASVEYFTVTTNEYLTKSVNY